ARPRRRGDRMKCSNDFSRVPAKRASASASRDPEATGLPLPKSPFATLSLGPGSRSASLHSPGTRGLRRRLFLALLGCAAAGWPVAARAQQPAPVIGYLNAASPGEYDARTRAFLEGLRGIGYVDGRNVTIEYRWAEGRYDL